MSAQEAITGAPASRLARRLGLFDAVVIGLGSMIGAGVFAAVAPASRAAGNAMLLGLFLAAFVAYCNATSSAQLAALYPESGGAYVYGRRRLGPFWGFLAGWGFVVGKLASCVAMALTFSSYAAPSWAKPLGVAAVLAITTVNYFGVRKTAALTRIIVTIVLASLSLVVAAILLGGAADPGRLRPTGISLHGVFQSAGLLFFAFAGYARIATLGEEVVDPERTIPKAIPLALGITVFVYAVVAASALVGLDIRLLASSAAPLAAAVEAGRFAGLSPVVRAGAAVASLGVLLSLVVGISRTMFSMAANRDLPQWLAAVHPRYKVPHRAELLVGALVAAVVSLADIRSAIGFSSFAVLTYYAITNASALSLSPAERRWPKGLAVAGLVGCVLLALSLPVRSVLGGVIVIGLGGLAYLLKAPRRA